MKKKTEKKLPRKQVVEKQKERVRKVLELDKEALESVRGGTAMYGLPRTRDCSGSI